MRGRRRTFAAALAAAAAVLAVAGGPVRAGVPTDTPVPRSSAVVQGSRPDPDAGPGAATPGGAVMPVGAADPGGAEDDVTTGAVWVPVAALAGVALLALYALRRRRAKTHPVRTSAGRGATEWRPPRAKQPVPVTPLPELDTQASELLVATDDAVRTSQEDVGFAAAQCGETAAGPFAEAVRYAEDESGAAFRLRRRLDDGSAADDGTRRQMLDEILSRCTQANRRLDAESEAFDRLRAMEANAPRVLERAEAAAMALPERITAAEATLTALAERYAATAVEPVAGHPAEATDRLAFARASLERARAAIDRDRGRTAVLVRAAEGALDQAAALTAAVTRREQELRTAEAALRDALDGAEADLAEARALLAEAAAPGTPGAPPPDLRDRAADAEGVLAAVRKDAADARPDPFAALRRLDPAADALAAALPGTGGSGSEARALEALGMALLVARGEVAAARDEVTAHRGAVGAEARTRLAEAERQLRLAEAGAGAPREALPDAREADRLAREARLYAGRDVSRSSGRLRAVDGDAEGLAGAVLGGILLGDLTGGGEAGSYGYGGYGGGLGGGSLGGGPATFGGTRTRTRLGSTPS